MLSAWFALAAKELVIGASEPFTEFASSPLSFREAETALEIARCRTMKSGHLSERRSVLLLDEVDLASCLLAGRQAPQLDDKVQKYVLSLDLDVEHIGTLIVYLAHDQDVARTAH